MKMYQPPTREFFRLPNKIFHVPMDATQFKLYSYLVCCSGSKGHCWPTHDKIMRDTGIKKSSLQKAIKILKKRQLIEVRKHHNPYGYSNNEYHLLSLDNAEIYRDIALADNDELPLISEESICKRDKGGIPPMGGCLRFTPAGDNLRGFYEDSKVLPFSGYP